MKEFLKQLCAGAIPGTVSSKRVVGLVMMGVCLVCIMYLVVYEGGTVIVENLLQTCLITAASLLGISSVTSIWKGGSVRVDNRDGEPGGRDDTDRGKMAFDDGTGPCEHCQWGKKYKDE